jgi:hypothetical protein
MLLLTRKFESVIPVETGIQANPPVNEPGFTPARNDDPRQIALLNDTVSLSAGVRKLMHHFVTLVVTVRCFLIEMRDDAPPAQLARRVAV